MLDARAALGHLAVDAPLQIGVRFRLQNPERPVLQLGLEVLDAEAMGDRSIDRQRLVGQGPAGVLRHLAGIAHVMQPVRQQDQNDAQVACTGQNHLAHMFGARGLSAVERGPAQPRQFFHQPCRLLAHCRMQCARLGKLLLQNVVQQPRHDAACVEAEVRQDAAYLQGMLQGRLSLRGKIVPVKRGGINVGLADQIEIGIVGHVGRHFGDEVVDSDHVGNRLNDAAVSAPNGEGPITRADRATPAAAIALAIAKLPDSGTWRLAFRPQETGCSEAVRQRGARRIGRASFPAAASSARDRCTV